MISKHILGSVKFDQLYFFSKKRKKLDQSCPYRARGAGRAWLSDRQRTGNDKRRQSLHIISFISHPVIQSSRCPASASSCEAPHIRACCQLPSILAASFVAARVVPSAHRSPPGSRRRKLRRLCAPRRRRRRQCGQRTDTSPSSSRCRPPSVHTHPLIRVQISGHHGRRRGVRGACQ